MGEDISILIRLDNYTYNFICECGDASELTVKDCQNTEAIFISHTHIDHFIHFDFILRHQIGIQRKIIICGPAGITQQIQSKIRGYQWNLIQADAITYEVREILPDRSIKRSEIKPPFWDIVPIQEEIDLLFQNERFQVSFTILDHKTASIAYLFREKDTVKINLEGSEFKGGKWVRDLKQAFEAKNTQARIEIEGVAYAAQDLFHLLEIKKGDTLGVIMDHAAHEENHQKIEALFHACHTVYIESFYKKEDQAFAQANYHSCSEASAKIMKRSQVKHAIPVHFSRKYTEEEVGELIEEFERVFEQVEN